MSSLNRRNWLGLIGAGSIATTIEPFIPHSTSIIKENIPPKYDYAKLNSNENPLGPSPKVRQAIIDAFDYGCRYPGAHIRKLAEKIAAAEGVSAEHVVITGGSTEGLKAAGLTYGVKGGEIITSDPVYKSLNIYAEQLGAYINRVPLDAELQQNLAEMADRITNRTSLVFLCNPHNPSGAIVPKNDLIEFCDNVSDHTILFSDEAYYDYITEEDYPSMVEMVKKNKNVIVSKTFSKVYGLAGLRIGYLLARPDIAQRIRKHVMARTNILAVFGALACYEDKSFYEQSLKLNNESKKLIYNTLDELDLKYIPSHTNFVFFYTGQPIQNFNKVMFERGVAVGRPFPPLTKWCRVSTGSLDDVNKFCAELKKVMA